VVVRQVRAQLGVLTNLLAWFGPAHAGFDPKSAFFTELLFQ
jgi:hypothetical protein